MIGGESLVKTGIPLTRLLCKAKASSQAFMVLVLPRVGPACCLILAPSWGSHTSSELPAGSFSQKNAAWEGGNSWVWGIMVFSCLCVTGSDVQKTAQNLQIITVR